VDERGGRDFWGSFQHDPRHPATAALRAADVDRELVQQALTEAFAEGRLDREEYDERSTAVLQARTLGELPAFVADLVPERPLLPARPRGSMLAASDEQIRQQAEQYWRHQRREAVGAFVFLSVVNWVIWTALLLAGNFVFVWPAIVSAVFGMNLVRVVLSKDDTVEQRVRKLERRRARELQARARKNDDRS
jgi:hypothetical protein